MLRASTSASIEVKVGRYNERTQVISVPVGSSVQDVLNGAGISLNPSESIWVEGEKAEATDTVENGDNLQIVGKKEGGANDEEENDSPELPEDMDNTTDFPTNEVSD